MTAAEKNRLRVNLKRIGMISSMIEDAFVYDNVLRCWSSRISIDSFEELTSTLAVCFDSLRSLSKLD